MLRVGCAVTTLDNQIRERLDGRWDEDDAIAAFEALRAVLDLHQAKRKGTHPLYLAVECASCSSHVTTVEWPCTTLLAIASALGITQEAIDGN